MKGTVKWFSRQKGLGLVQGDDEVERLCYLSDITGAALPASGDTVSFEHRDGDKGPQATGVTLETGVPQDQSTGGDERVRCANCGEMMVPRVITGPPLVRVRGWTSVPNRSICPLCAHTHEKFPASTGEVVRLVAFILMFVIVGLAILLDI